MAICRHYRHDFTDGNGQTFHVFEADNIDLSVCGQSFDDRIIMEHSEYYELTVKQAGIGPVGDATAVVAILMCICAVLGFRAGNAWQ